MRRTLIFPPCTCWAGYRVEEFRLTLSFDLFMMHVIYFLNMSSAISMYNKTLICFGHLEYIGVHVEPSAQRFCQKLTGCLGVRPQGVPRQYVALSQDRDTCDAEPSLCSARLEVRGDDLCCLSGEAFIAKRLCTHGST